MGGNASFSLQKGGTPGSENVWTELWVSEQLAAPPQEKGDVWQYGPLLFDATELNTLHCDLVQTVVYSGALGPMLLIRTLKIVEMSFFC